MGIFNFTDNKTNTNQGNTPIKITLPTDVLASLSLTTEDIEAYHSGIIEKEAKEAGINYYKENATNITQAPPIKLGEIALSPKVQDKSDLVPSLYTQLETMAGAMESTMPPTSLQSIKNHLTAFSNGYGQAAQDANDWQSSLKSFDKTTQGGITKKQDTIKKFGDLYKNDLEIRIKIAELLQELVNHAQKSFTLPKTETPAISTPPNSISIQTSTEPAPPPPVPSPQPTPTPTPTPIINLKPQNPNEIPLTPTINLAQSKPSTPITTPEGLVLRPVPQQNPTSLIS